MAKIEKFITKTLLNNGFSQEELSAMSNEEITKTYKEGIQRLVNAFNTHPKEEHTHKVKNPFLELKSPDEIYEIPIDFLAHLGSEDVTLMIHRKFRSIPIDKVQKITSLLFCIFQEKILGEIESKIASLPEDEKRSIMEIYERQKDDTQHLLQINERLRKEKFRQQFEKVLEIKSMIHHYKERLEEEE
ncbi:hypothetical protein [Helicobacter brantae]|uniref:Uncharacterized protein n=1 Tax=Helicobacter brantae TaxID=375927 RepID=A0A3D8IW45_9HELI|nr:hypothetical protein [Helicobacter brantae]RDU69186.1 hypothetical protein CQA58_07350 [Helicobacter brantae]